MVRTYTIQQYRKKITKKTETLSKKTNLVLKDIATFGRLRIKFHAPVKTGRLRRGIFMNKTKKGYMIESHAVSNDGFPYNKWVNQDKGFRTIKLFGSVPSVYGQFPSFRWTASSLGQKVGFFNAGILDMRRLLLSKGIKKIRLELLR